MPRSPSPSGSRGSGGRGGYYNRDQRERFRDRPFQPNRSHPDDRDGWNRNEGRSWGNYRSRRDDYDDYRDGQGSSRGGNYYARPREGGYDSRGRSRSRSRSRDPPFRERDRDRDRDENRSQATASGSRSRIPSPEKSRRSSATPEEGQITSPAPPPRGTLAGRSPLPYRSPAPRSTGRRSASPPRRYDRDRELDRDRVPPRRYHDRDRGYSPRRSRSPYSDSSRSRSRISSPDKSRPRSPARRSPPPTHSGDVRRVEVSQRPPWEDRKAGIHRPPPTGPRGDRAPPTGPRALSLSGPLPTIPPLPRATVQAETPASPPRAPTQASAPSAPIVNPYDPSLASNQTPSGPRLSWSERKKLSPTDVKPLVNPYGGAGRLSVAEAASSSPINWAPTPIQVDSPGGMSPSPSMRMMPAAPVVKTEAELAEIRAKEEEARVLAELPEIKVPFGGSAWESEVRHNIPRETEIDVQLGKHYAAMQTLEQNTLRSQSNMRLSLAILVDAEIEHAAAGERRKVASAQHQLAIDQGMGILGT